MGTFLGWENFWDMEKFLGYGKLFEIWENFWGWECFGELGMFLGNMQPCVKGNQTPLTNLSVLHG